MLIHARVPSRLAAGGLLVLGLVFLAAAPESVAEPPNAKEIADLEKQIGELTKKLNELRQKSGVPADGAFNPEWLKALSWRCIGPAAMGGRITALAVYEADPSTYWVATASGGLLKTVNNGNTFEHQFDRESTVSIGDVAVAQSDKNIVWIGTGENNPRNSVSYGDGVYKSTDGGKTWKNMGLRKSFQIGRIVIHPKNPNIVYVGALGRLYGPNPERGLFKTTDGGQTWEKIHFVDDKTGVIDVQMHPTDPETLLVATWERQRDEFDSWFGEPAAPEGFFQYDPVKKWAPGTMLWKTTDGGKTFAKANKGLPLCNLGRMGIDWYRKEPNVVYLVVDCEKIGMGPPQAEPGFLGIAGEDAEVGAKLTQVTKDSPAEKAGLQAGDIILSVDNKLILSYKQLVETLQNQKVGDKLTLQVSRKREKKELAVSLGKRPGPQGNQKRPFTSHLGGQSANVQDKQGPDGWQYGGVYRSTDGGETWTRINSLNPRPMYFSQIRVDPTDANYVYVLGIALHRSRDGGKTFTDDGGHGVHPDQHALWINPRDGRHMIVGCDGGFYATYDRMQHWDFLNHVALGQFYHVAVDTRQPYHVYGGLQDNGSWGGPSRSLRYGSGIINEDWTMVGGGDGFVCRVDEQKPDVVYFESQDGGLARRHLKTGEFAGLRPKAPQGTAYRFNWNTPFILSQHNSHIVYMGGNFVFRSFRQGDDLRPISPEITRTKRGSATALAESPRNAAVLWAGTDDGALWVTRDGGGKWTNVAEKLGLPGPRWIASIEASRFAEGRAYVVCDAHRSDDDEPYVFVTEDFGQTWHSLRANLPTGSTRVLREDVTNPDLLYLGTEFTAWTSLDRGKSWHKLNANLPTVAVHEIAVHPTAGEIVAATHGRSLWVLDVTSLRQMTAEVFKEKVHLFEPQPTVRWRSEASKGSIYGMGSRHFIGQDPPRGAQIYYSLAKKADKVSLKIADITGKVIKELPGKTDAGLNRVSWELTGKLGRSGESPVTPGVYRVLLTVDGVELTQTVRVEPDPTVPSAAAESYEELREREKKARVVVDH